MSDERYVEVEDGVIVDVESGDTEVDLDLSYVFTKYQGAGEQRDSWDNVRRALGAVLMKKFGDRDQMVINNFLVKIASTPSYKVDGEKLADYLEEIEAPRDLLLNLIRVGLGREAVGMLNPDAITVTKSRAFLRISAVRKLAPGGKK